MKISKFLSLETAIRSMTAKKLGINNMPGNEELKNLIKYGFNIYDPICEFFRSEPYTHTIYRSPELNQAVKGDPNSQHIKGQAGDHDYDHTEFITNSQLFHFIVNNPEFDRVIWEFGNELEPDWVHVSYSEKYRRQIGFKAKDLDYIYFTDLLKFDEFKMKHYEKLRTKC